MMSNMFTRIGLRDRKHGWWSAVVCLSLEPIITPDIRDIRDTGQTGYTREYWVYGTREKCKIYKGEYQSMNVSKTIEWWVWTTLHLFSTWNLQYFCYWSKTLQRPFITSRQHSFSPPISTVFILLSFLIFQSLLLKWSNIGKIHF